MAVESILAPIFTGIGAVLILIVVGIFRGWFKEAKPIPSLAAQQTPPITPIVESTPEATTSDIASSQISNTTVEVGETSVEAKLEVTQEATVPAIEQVNPEITYPITTTAPVNTIVEVKETVETPVEAAIPQTEPSQHKTRPYRRTRRQGSRTRKAKTLSTSPQ